MENSACLNVRSSYRRLDVVSVCSARWEKNKCFIFLSRQFPVYHKTFSPISLVLSQDLFILFIYYFTYSLLFTYSLYLFSLQTEREREKKERGKEWGRRERTFSIHWLTPNWLQWPKLDQAKARDCIQVSHMGAMGPSTGLSLAALLRWSTRSWIGSTTTGT